MDMRSREIIHKYKSILSQIVSYGRIKLLVQDYKIFTRAMLDDIFTPDSNKDFYDELCTRGPDAFFNFIKVLKNTGYEELANILQNELSNETFPIYYKMDSNPLGYCLIIINEKFDAANERIGCEVDASALENLFRKLNYDVKIEWNKERDEMISILKKFSKKSEFKDVHSCIVYILSHGGQYENLDYILGIDCKKVYKKDIYSMFNDENCELLIDKPKIFIFQACRGKLLDYGANKRCDEKATKNNICENTEKQSSPDARGISNHKYTKSISADMFIVHSSLPDHKSWKNHCQGSWLCQDLVSVIEEYYDRYDLGTMMTFVNSKQVTRESKDGCKQVAHVESTLTGLIHFNRGKKEASPLKQSY